MPATVVENLIAHKLPDVYSILGGALHGPRGGNMYSRRNFLIGSFSLLSGFGFELGRGRDSARAEDYQSNPKEISVWMNDWMSRTKDVEGPLRIGRFADPTYFLLRPITWKPSSEQGRKYQSVTVPIGFVTDFASIPRIFWSLLKPDGLYAYAAVLHDYLYWTQEQSKDAADDILKLGMEEFGVSSSVVSTIYSAVHLFGKSSWDQDVKLKAAGEKRVLQQFPDNPRITWEQWKKSPGVFGP